MGLARVCIDKWKVYPMRYGGGEEEISKSRAHCSR